MVMEMDFTGEDAISGAVMMNQVRKKKKGTKTKTKRKSGKKKDCGCPK